MTAIRATVFALISLAAGPPLMELTCQFIGRPYEHYERWARLTVNRLWWTTPPFDEAVARMVKEDIVRRKGEP